MNRKTSTGLILGGALIVAAGYGATATATQAATPQAAHGSSMVMGHTVYRASGPVITIKNYRYVAPRSVKKRATITVRNNDSVAHTVTSNAGLYGVKIPAHATRTFRAPSKAGAFKFHCNFHSNMHGTLKVG